MGIFEFEEKIRGIACGIELQLCDNTLASNPDIMYCVNCNRLQRALYLYRLGYKDGKQFVELKKGTEL